MKIIKRGVIDFFALILFLILTGCNSSIAEKDSRIDVSLLDVFAYVPERDSLGTIIGQEEMQFVFEFQNLSEPNYYFEFDNWMKDKQDSIHFYILSSCKNRLDSMKINLAYITRPMLFLPSGHTDTVALKTDFRELRTYFYDCIKAKTEEDVEDATRDVHIIYEVKTDKTKVERQGVVFKPIRSFSRKIRRKKS